MKDIKFLVDNINIPEAISNIGTVVAVGSFDGVHLGHKAMLDALKEESSRRNLPSVVLTFDVGNSPKSGFGALASEHKKKSLLEGCGTDFIVSLPFDEIKDVSASDFAVKILFEKFCAKAIVCGYDFRFGKGREGDTEILRTLLSENGVEIVIPSVVTFEENPISSTAIRSAIANGDFNLVNRLLGYGFSFESEIIKGQQLGRTLGFPTVNQKYPDSLVVPKFGVYAVRIMLRGKLYNGVANFGIKPTVSTNPEPICETYIFDYNGDCYGETVETVFVSMIREEKRFSSLEELANQVEKDKLSAIDILSKGV